MNTALAAPTTGPASHKYPLAPPIDAELWLNTLQPITLESLRDRVIVIEAFQMLCPGCVAHGLPQAKEIQRHFDSAQVAVLGLHSVFEHHDAMKPVSLRAFAHENRLTFPIAVDRHDEKSWPLPKTMRAYGLEGTPSLLIIDQQGRLRARHFGHVSDLIVGATIGDLLASPHSPLA
ncbi:alkyl hydroperoxide reductase [Nibricoccus aquaticus]|uniref:Alkyl hydroperoxide reductase n=1 Tax=Nibricoccus aquaticus TaxID=2576891 RepID=A0A290QF35_9BACT|nr:redoxin domain-containing protein [Nibricoccus aquaticus]ATC64886.1 alkyl hydroperoxide reductase [Nibricoccus aquaticus]